MQKILFFVSTTTLLTASWDFVNNCALNLIYIKVSLMEPLETLQAQSDAADHAIIPWFTMMAWPININVRTSRKFFAGRFLTYCTYR